MEDFDKTLTINWFKQLDGYLATLQPFVLVGAYGLGKTRVHDYLLSLDKTHFKVIIVDLSFFNVLTEAELFTALVQALEFSAEASKRKVNSIEDDFYLRLNKTLNNLKAKQLVLIIRHAEKLLTLNASVINRLNNYIYSNKEKLLLVGSASPRLINFPVAAVSALFSNNILYMPRLDEQSSKEVIKFQAEKLRVNLDKYTSKILELSHKVNGAIIFLCRVLAKYQPKDFNNRFLLEVVYKQPQLYNFFEECISALTPEQIEIIYEYCLHKQLTKATQNRQAFKQLVALNIFYASGKNYEFIYELFNGFILHNLKKTNVDLPKAYRELGFVLARSKGFSPDEARLMQILLEKQGNVATYEEIAAFVYKDTKKFSLYAINKLVSRVRIALLKQQDLKCRIMTKYKRGYYLVC